MFTALGTLADFPPSTRGLDYQQFPSDLQKHYFERDVLQVSYSALQIRGLASLTFHEPM